MSGWPMFKWYTFTPLFFAASAKGTSLRMGEAGISWPRLLIGKFAMLQTYIKMQLRATIIYWCGHKKVAPVTGRQYKLVY
jgi:hypothetical protein